LLLIWISILNHTFLGSAIIFVAILKQFVLGHPLQRFKWIGIGYNVISIVLVGLTAMLSASGGSSAEAVPVAEGEFQQNPLLGVFLILCGAFVQSLQYAFEERVMTDVGSEEMPPTPPLLLIGMEGLWGTVICIFLLYPLAMYIPGNDHGCFENFHNTYYMITHNTAIWHIFLVYFFSVFLYNMLAVLVTFVLDSVWHAILDNFRPITVWGLDLFIYYAITKSFGEAWSSSWSWVQLLGMGILLYGTGIYNAPNAGSIRLKGDLASCYLDCSDEYPETGKQGEDDPLVQTNKGGVADADKQSQNMPFYEGVKPMVMLSPEVNKRNRDRERERERERMQASNARTNSSKSGGYGSTTNK
jgi:hypothetical protein